MEEIEKKEWLIKAYELNIPMHLAKELLTLTEKMMKDKESSKTV